MFSLSVPDIDRQAFERGYNGNIDSDILLSEDESLLYKCMCFEIKNDEIYWQRLILTNKKIIHLWKNRVKYIYLKHIKRVRLECANKSNKEQYDYKIGQCIEMGNTPYFLTINGDEFLLNNKNDAITLLDEINRLICEW